jgi:hypothetical protein
VCVATEQNFSKRAYRSIILITIKVAGVFWTCMERTNPHHLLAAHGLRRTAVAALLAFVAVFALVAAVAAPGTAATVLVTVGVLAVGRRLRALATDPGPVRPATPAK